MNLDLGTYYVRVEFAAGDGFIMRWDTGRRYTDGAGDCSPLTAKAIAPGWESEEDLALAIEFMFSEGNYSCDCNKRLFLDRAHQRPEQEEFQCGETMRIKALILIRPDGSELPLEIDL